MLVQPEPQTYPQTNRTNSKILNLPPSGPQRDNHGSLITKESDISLKHPDLGKHATNSAQSPGRVQKKIFDLY